MKDKWKILIASLILSVFCPIMLYHFFSRTQATQIQLPIAVVDTDQQEITQPMQNELTIDVLDQEGTVQTMAMEEYLTCVVLREMPADFELEALKAQAVVARTYALRLGTMGSKHTGAAVCMNSNCCQGYCTVEEYLSDGGTKSSVDKVRSAVIATKDIVLTYNEELIDATYFSCSGGTTEDAQAVWGADVPYLKATESPGEEKATHFMDTVTLTSKEFAQALGILPTGNPGTWIESVSYTNGGGVDVMKICGTAFKGTTMRKLLGLRSTVFVITAVGDNITITTKGFGHRVGMSQYGADAMAVDGSTYEEILAHYYQETKLSVYTG